MCCENRDQSFGPFKTLPVERGNMAVGQNLTLQTMEG